MKLDRFYPMLTLLFVVSLLFPLSVALAVNDINATFEGVVSYTHFIPNDFIAGQVVPTGNNKSDRPMEIGGAEAGFLIENSGTISGPTLGTGNFLRVVDVDDYMAYGASFDFFTQSYNSGCVYVAWDVLFETNDYYFFYYRNGYADDPTHPSKSSIANIYTSGNFLFFQTQDGIVYRTQYATGVPIHFDTYLDLDNNQWAVFMNGQLLFNNAHIMDAPLGRFIIGYGHDSNYIGAMQVDNVVMLPKDGCTWPEFQGECSEKVPLPMLVFIGTEDYSTSDGNFTEYKLFVTNWEDIPPALFREAPDLPPCGLNKNSSRTWVDIYDGEGNRIYGFCALGDPSMLTRIWFARPRGETPPSKVKIVMEDRLCQREYESNYVDITEGQGYCQEFPVPVVEFTGTEGYAVKGESYTRYNLEVTNWNQYAQELFVPSPNLPACGLNTNAARTWVDIYDDQGNYIYGFCGLGKPENLRDIWFSRKTSVPPPTAVKVVLRDRLCETSVESAPVYIDQETLHTLEINVHGSGRVISTDGEFLCESANITGDKTCSFNVISGETVTLDAIPIHGSQYTSSFLTWTGACSGTANCTISVTGDASVEAKFAALGTPVALQLAPPSGTQVFSYSPVADPVLDANASKCKPFAIGDLSSGAISLMIGLPPFTGPVDIYLGLQALPVSPFEIFLFKSLSPLGYTIVPYSASGLVPWETNTVNPQFQSFYGSIPTSVLPKGGYTLYTLVTPSGSFSSYYLWVTSFEIE